MVRVGAYVLDVEEQNRTVEIEVELDDAAFAATLLPGTSADVEVILETRDGRAAHPDARRCSRATRCWSSRADGWSSARSRSGSRNWDVTEIRERPRRGRSRRRLARPGRGEGRGAGRRSSAGTRRRDPPRARLARLPGRRDGGARARRRERARPAGRARRDHGAVGLGEVDAAQRRSAASTGPTVGRYWLDGREVAALDDAELTQVRRHLIGFVFQSFHLVPRLTAAENVELPMVFAGVARGRAARARGRGPRRPSGSRRAPDHRPEQLSGGERQRVAIARAMVMRPRLLLADEPTGNLDTASGRQVLDLLDGLHASGSRSIVVTHDPNVARRARARARDDRRPHRAPARVRTSSGRRIGGARDDRRSARASRLGALRGHRVRTGAHACSASRSASRPSIVLTALGDGARRYVVGQFESLGSNLLAVVPGEDRDDRRGGRSSSVTTRDLTLARRRGDRAPRARGVRAHGADRDGERDGRPRRAAPAGGGRRLDAASSSRCAGCALGARRSSCRPATCAAAPPSPCSAPRSRASSFRPTTRSARSSASATCARASSACSPRTARSSA